MGIFGALQSAVSGLKAQSHAMENISGNIANSQTIGYKRIDTSFLDMIPDAPVKSQVAGAVSSFSRSMNTLRGDIQNADTETYMALNGNGFFVVEKSDGGGGTFYTRRGDFDIDRNGYLVNGAGYRLTGLGMDNGVVSGSVAEAIKIDNSFLPAKRTTTIDYQLNLPQNPKTSSYVSTTPGSELLKPWSYNTVVGTTSTPARTGTVIMDPATFTVPSYGVGGPAVPTALGRSLVGDGDTLTVTINGVDTDIEFIHTGPAGAGQIEVEATDTVDDLITDIQTALGATATISLKNGSIYVRLPDASADTLAFSSTRADGSTTSVLGLNGSGTPSVAAGSATADNTPADMFVAHGDTMTIKVGEITRTYRMNTTGTLAVSASEKRINASGTLKEMLADIEADLKVNGGPGGAGAVLSLTDLGEIDIKFGGNYRYDVTISNSGATALGIDGPLLPAAPGELNAVSGTDSELFVKESISGGGITVYSNTGEPVNVQIRWGKLTSEAGVDTWGMFYASDSNPGAAEAWTKLADYEFKDGVLTTVRAAGGVTVTGTEKLTIDNLKVNGRNFGELSIAHGLKGMTQFADNSGMATTTTLTQNGFGAGEFISVGISDEGQVVASYTNGETKAVAQIVTASFSNANALKRGDGGTYTATTESGEPIIDQSGTGIVGSSTEASNTDISEEFTKLIVTQQAYSANTKIVTAADEMLQEALNMIR